MYKIYEVDYWGRTFLIGESETIKEACKIERKALKKSNREFPTFTTDGNRQITNNGKIL